MLVSAPFRCQFIGFTSPVCHRRNRAPVELGWARGIAACNKRRGPNEGKNRPCSSSASSLASGASSRSKPATVPPIDWLCKPRPLLQQCSGGRLMATMQQCSGHEMDSEPARQFSFVTRERPAGRVRVHSGLLPRRNTCANLAKQSLWSPSPLASAQQLPTRSGDSDDNERRKRPQGATLIGSVNGARLARREAATRRGGPEIA